MLKIRQKVVGQQARPPPKSLLWSNNHFDRIDDSKLGKWPHNLIFQTLHYASYCLQEIKFSKDLCTLGSEYSLTKDRKVKRTRTSAEHFNRVHNNDNFLVHLIPRYELWVRYSTSHWQQYPMTWKQTVESPDPKKFNQILFSKKKLMVTVFWDAWGMAFIEFISKGETINANYCIEILNKF